MRHRKGEAVNEMAGRRECTRARGREEEKGDEIVKWFCDASLPGKVE